MTTLRVPSWERTLILLASEAWHPVVGADPVPVRDAALLDRAYRHCEAITAAHSKTFHAATRLLPPEKRRAVRALYAFCRVSDNVVDCPEADADTALALAAWRRRAMSSQPAPGDLVAVAWADTRLRYHIPYRYAEQLIEGVERDLCQSRYETFDDLAAYAYGVASTVGLMAMHIIGFSGEDAMPYAVRLGVALQLTNILRDVGEDWRAGRVYLPVEELADFGLSEADLAAGRVDDRWRAFMGFQIARNRRLYDESLPGIVLLNRDGRVAVAAAGKFYRAILDDIEAHDYDVFHRRAHIGAWNKLVRLPDLWWEYR